MSIKFFGQFLLERKVISPDQLIEAVKFQESQNLKFGDYAVSKGYLTEADVKNVLARQKQVDMQFGELAVQMGLLTKEKVEEILTIQKNDRFLLGQAILSKGFMTAEALDRELENFRKDQSQYAPGEIIIPVGAENPLIIRDIVDLTQKMLLRVANIRAKVDAGIISTEEPEKHYATIVTRFRGSLSYDYVFSAKRSTSVTISTGVTSQNTSEESDEIVLDGVKEFCNIVCGNVMAKLAQRGKSVNISAPDEIPYTSKGYSIVKGRRALSFPFRATEGDITLIIIPS